MAHSTQTSEISLLTTKIAEAEKRMVALEKRVAELEARLSWDDDPIESFDNYYGDDDSDPVQPEPVTPKRGRRPRISGEEFAKRRDDLVRFIELRWPALEDCLTRNATVEGVIETLKANSPGAEQTWAYRQLTDHVGILWEFLRSGRYKGEPRQIAYAMAGVPQLAWRSSLDCGVAHPSSLRIFPPSVQALKVKCKND